MPGNFWAPNIGGSIRVHPAANSCKPARATMQLSHTETYTKPELIKRTMEADRNYADRFSESQLLYLKDQVECLAVRKSPSPPPMPSSGVWRAVRAPRAC